MDTVEATNCMPDANVSPESTVTLNPTHVEQQPYKEWIRKKYDFLKEEKNLGVITWLTTLFTTFSVAYLKLIRYVSESGKLAYWNLPVSVIDISGDNVVYDIIMSVVFASVLVIFLLVPFLVIKSKLNRLYKVIINLLIAAIISTSMFFSGNTKDIVLSNGLSGILAFALTDILFLGIFFGPSILFWTATLPPKQSKVITKKMIVPLIVFFLIFNLVYFNITSYCSEAKETLYRITNDGYAIIYETDEHYYLAKYNIESKIIDKSIQKTIAKTDVEYTWTTVIK